MNVLFAATVVSLVFTLPHFAPENLFQSLNARLALPTNLFNVRLNALRGAAGLGEDDKMFLSKLESEGDKWRLIYAAYGADAALHCPFCTVSEPKTYMYYALAAIALPHLAHVFLLGLITSSFFSGPEGSRWRTYATIAGVSLALLEFYATWNYRWEANAQTRILAEVDFFAQRMRVYRHLAFAACDALLGWMLYLTSTNRWLVKPPSTTEQLQQLAQQAAATHAQVNLLGNVKNAVVRDAELRGRGDLYWRREQEEMAGIMQDEHVRTAVTSVLAREDYDKTRRRAQIYVEQVLNATALGQLPRRTGI